MDTKKYKRMFNLEDTYWWFLAKHKIVQSLISLYYGSSTKGVTALDLGCGTGAFLNRLDSMGIKAYGLDISKEAINFCIYRRRGELVQGNIEGEMPFRDNTFHIVTGLDVIEHVDNYQNVIIEACRILKPNGLLVVTTPAFKFLWNQHDEVHHHKRRFVRKELKTAIEATGKLRILKLSYYNFFLFFIVCLFRIFKKTFCGIRGQSDDFLWVPPMINKFLFKIFGMESFFLKCVNLPFGVSIIAIAKKQAK